MKQKIEWVTEEGWLGTYTRQQARGAMPNGTRVRKIHSEAKDGHKDGAMATVIGSFAAPVGLKVEGEIVNYFYFVEWDDMPRVGVGVSEHRIETALN